MIIAIEYSVKVAGCIFGVLGGLGAIVTIMIKATLDSLEGICKVDTYLESIDVDSPKDPDNDKKVEEENKKDQKLD